MTKKEKLCNCVCSPSCHIYRQQLQVEFIEEGTSKGIEDCPFYELLIDHYKNKEK